MSINDNLIVGIMGKMGSGKTTISRIFETDYQFTLLEVDKFGHKALESEHDLLVETFGEDIMDHDGTINRRILGNKVFSDTEKLSLLNAIVHPRIKADIIRTVEQYKDCRFIIDAAILFEIGLDELCDYIIYIEAPEEMIRRRVTESRNWEDERVNNILNAQSYLECLKEKTDFIIFNNKDDLKLKKQIEFFMLIITDY